METINDIIYELNGNTKTKALAKRIELARINDEQRWRKDIADTRRLTAERMMEGIELTEKDRCSNCIARGNLMETTDKILCEMRKDIPRVVDTKVILRNYADRIEAAIKRENALNTNPAENVNSEKVIYNAAKMREALKQIAEMSDHWYYGVDTSKSSEDVVIACGQLAENALAAPPRNCDRFVDELDAQIEFLNDVWLISVTKDTMLERDKFENWTEEMKSRYAKWLLAKAEGGAK